MRLSTTDIYALQSLGYLGAYDSDCWKSSEEISGATGIARPYLVRILATLSNKGIVVSKKGTGGGYALARPPAEISLKEVMRAIDGPVAPLACVSLLWHESCEQEIRCHARSAIWLKVRDAMLSALETLSVADLAADFIQDNDYRDCLKHLLRAGS